MQSNVADQYLVSKGKTAWRSRLLHPTSMNLYNVPRHK